MRPVAIGGSAGESEVVLRAGDKGIVGRYAVLALP